jgi:hypothetical protein
VTSPTDTKALAALRPGDGKDKLVAAAGERWIEPHPALAGKVLSLKEEVGFTARLDGNGAIGNVVFEWPFDREHRIEGLHLGMNDAEVENLFPGQLSAVSDINGLYRYAHVILGSGATLFIATTSEKVTRIAIRTSSSSRRRWGRSTWPVAAAASTS